MYAPVTGFNSLYYGNSSIEAAENGVLAGTDDRLFVQRLTSLLTGRDTRGGNVLLTINKQAQAAAYQAMGSRRGAVVALDPATGAILAAVSTPSYDPNALSSHSPDADPGRVQALQRRPGQPAAQPRVQRRPTRRARCSRWWWPAPR